MKSGDAQKGKIDQPIKKCFKKGEKGHNERDNINSFRKMQKEGEAKYLRFIMRSERNGEKR